VSNQDSPPRSSRAVAPARPPPAIEMVGGFVEDQELYRMGKYPSKATLFRCPPESVATSCRSRADTETLRAASAPTLGDGSPDSAGKTLAPARENHA